MSLTGRCYCGALRYEVSGDPIFQIQCHCRECQYISGGAPNMAIGFPIANFEYTQGEPRGFARKDLETAVTREFCGECGTHIVSKPPGMPAAIIKVGTLDDPSQFTPQMAIQLLDKQSFHHVPDGITTFDRMPG